MFLFKTKDLIANETIVFLFCFVLFYFKFLSNLYKMALDFNFLEMKVLF